MAAVRVISLRFMSAVSRPITPTVPNRLPAALSVVQRRCFGLVAEEAPKKKISAGKVAVVGAGKMAEAMIGGMLRSEAIEPSRIVAADVNADRLEFFRQTFGVDITHDNIGAIKDAQVVLLAIKPQTMPYLLPQVHNKFRDDALIISIVAGHTAADISNGSGVRAVVRSMPNTPALVGKSMTVWTSNHGVTDAQKRETQAVLGSFGSELYVNDETYLDMATALSGTGPAYFFMIIEAMIDAGVHIGFPRDVARMLVLKTIEGTAQLALNSANHPARLRNDITSPGGTSASALYEIERGGLRTVIGDAVWAAYRRSLEMGGRNSCVGPGRFIQHGVSLTPHQVERMLESAIAGALSRAEKHR
eukprot:m.37815 g.37815  ORF g.37815 m.37815 type:complete len:361 (+) comp9874_c1_seq1:150-1232(+)